MNGVLLITRERLAGMSLLKATRQTGMKAVVVANIQRGTQQGLLPHDIERLRAFLKLPPKAFAFLMRWHPNDAPALLRSQLNRPFDRSDVAALGSLIPDIDTSPETTHAS